jgi:hypothetical protein
MLKSWSDIFVGNVCIQIEVTKEVILQLEKARDQRPLFVHEEGMRQELKLKSRGLSSLQRMIAQQESRVLWLNRGDALMKFFHIYASFRQCRNFIYSLEHEGKVLLSKDRKAEEVFNLFDLLLGTPPSLSSSQIRLGQLDLPQLCLSKLGDRFSGKEVWSVIKSLSPPEQSTRAEWIHNPFPVDCLANHPSGDHGDL